MILQLVRTECFFVLHLQPADSATGSDMFARRDTTNSVNGSKYLTDRLKAATRGVDDFNYSSAAVRKALQPFTAKCRELRRANLAENISRGFSSLHVVLERLGSLALERKFCFDKKKFPFREAMTQLLFGDIAEETDTTISLDLIHERVKMDKGRKSDRAEKLNFLSPLLSHKRREEMHAIYDKFVRESILPLLHAETKASGGSCHISDEYYYQCFPCTRVVRPGEFSIGVHSDCNYGFHPGNINFYLPLTNIWGTNSLVLESSPGAEDWRTLELSYGDVQRFHGSVCAHFTPENVTSATRVSLDFRILPGCVYESSHDQYISEPGYYVKSWINSSGAWVRERQDLGLVKDVDWRCGFPFTNK